MFIHISFTNRSNPYVKYCSDEKELEVEREVWGRQYILKEIKCTDSPTGKGYFYSATPKRGE